MIRYIETFFRYWLIALVPVVVLPLVLLASMKLSSSSVNVSTSIWVSSASVRELGYADPTMTPAQNLAADITQLLGSMSFNDQIAKQSPLYAHLAASQSNPKGWMVADLRKNVQLAAKGSNLATISYVGANAAVGAEVLRSLLRLAPTKLEHLNHFYHGSATFNVVDPPTQTAAPGGMKGSIMGGLIALGVGLLLSCAFIVVRTALDRSVHYASEVQGLLGLAVLTIVPHNPALQSAKSSVDEER